MIKKLRLNIQVRLMTIFYYCFVYSCPKGNVRNSYVKMFDITEKHITRLANMTEEELNELL